MVLFTKSQSQAAILEFLIEFRIFCAIALLRAWIKMVKMLKMLHKSTNIVSALDGTRDKIWIITCSFVFYTYFNEFPYNEIATVDISEL